MAGKNINEVILKAPATITIDGVDIGYTTGGVTLRMTQEMVDIDADQIAGTAKKVKVFEKCFVSFTVLQATLANMQKVMNEAAGNLAGSILALGSPTPNATEYVLTVAGGGPNAGTRTYTMYRAIPSGDVEHLIGSRDTPSSLPVEFECLKDPLNGNHFGVCLDT